MREDTRRAIHFGVNFLLSPGPVLTGRSLLDFEGRLADRGLTFEQREKGAGFLSLASAESGCQIRIEVKDSQVAQLLIIAHNPQGDLDIFIKQADAVCASYMDVWKNAQVQVHADATVRHLYQGSEGHAFKFLWERRLGQSEADLHTFGRPVLGGGLRFVMPPRNPADPQIELRIESFLQDSKMVWVEVQSAWAAPRAIPGKLDPEALLTFVYGFATKEVVQFIAATPPRKDRHA